MSSFFNFVYSVSWTQLTCLRLRIALSNSLKFSGLCAIIFILILTQGPERKTIPRNYIPSSSLTSRIFFIASYSLFLTDFSNPFIDLKVSIAADTLDFPRVVKLQFQQVAVPLWFAVIIAWASLEKQMWEMPPLR